MYANKYHFTPKQVDEMTEKEMNIFLAIENYTGEKQKIEATRQEHKQKAMARW